MALKKWIPGVLLIAMVAVPVLLFFARGPQAETVDDSGADSSASDQSRPREPGESPIAVKVVEARRGELVVRIKSPGEAVTEKRVVMKTEAAGVLKDLKAREGLHVRAGDLLAEIDDERCRLALERQKASRLRLLSETLLEERFGRLADRLAAPPEEIARAEENFARTKVGFSQGLISEAEFEKAAKAHELALIEAGVKKEEVKAASKGLTQAEIDVKTAELDLLKTSIRAPFSGIVTDVKVSPGENLGPGRELFTLVDISEIKVIVKVLESEVRKIQLGREVDLRFSAHPDRIFEGIVKAVSPVVDPQEKTCAVHVAVGNLQEEIKPGMHAEVEIDAEIHKDRLLVPQDAVLVRGGRKLVFVAEDGLAKWRYIEVGLENESYAEVLDGVREGETVIVDGHFTLAHDSRVSVSN